MPSLVATTSALARTMWVRTHSVRTNFGLIPCLNSHKNNPSSTVEGMKTWFELKFLFELPSLDHIGTCFSLKFYEEKKIGFTNFKKKFLLFLYPFLETLSFIYTLLKRKCCKVMHETTDFDLSLNLL